MKTKCLLGFHRWKLLAGAVRPTALPAHLVPPILIRETVWICQNCTRMKIGTIQEFSKEPRP